MLIETTRPLSPADEAALHQRLRSARNELRGAAFLTALLLAVGWCAWWGEPHVCVLICTGFMAASMSFGLVTMVADALLERPRLRRALRSTHVVEYEVTARTACQPASYEFVIFDVGGGRLFAQFARGWNWWTMLRAPFRLTVAKPSGLEVHRADYGLSWFRPRKVPALSNLIPDAAIRARILARLREQPVFLGSLDDLPAALLALGQVEPPPPVPVLPPVRPDWDAIQAYLEERFNHEFGVGRLAVAVGGLADPPTPHAVADVVLNFFPDPTLAPPNANRRRVLRELRESLAVALDRPPDSLRPTNRLDDLFPLSHRRKAWGVFRHAFGRWQTPRVPTDSPQWLGHVTTVAVILGLAAGLYETRAVRWEGFSHVGWAWALDYPDLYAVLALVGVPLVAFAGSYFPLHGIRRLFVRFQFPASMTTVNDLLQHALAAAGNGYTPPAIERPTPGELEGVIRDRWNEPLDHARIPNPEDAVPPDEREDWEDERDG